MGEVLKTIAGGGQTWAHRVRMLRQVFYIALVLSLAASFASFCFHIANQPKHRFEALVYFLKASVTSEDAVSISTDFAQAVTGKKYHTAHIKVGTKGLQALCEDEVALLCRAAKRDAKRSLGLGGIGFFCLLFFFFFRGKSAKRKKLISGQSIRLRKVKKFRAKGGLRIGNAVLERKHETKHILITGSTGSGKTNAIHHIVPQIRKRKGRAVVVDTEGAYVARYFNPKTDYILNPFDNRSSGWNPWIEITKKTDFKAVARCFVPIPEDVKNSDIFWKQSASTIFEALLGITSDTRDIARLQNLLQTANLSILSEQLEGTKGASLVSKEGEKLAHSVRAVLNTRTECLEHLEKAEQPFSITEWVEQEQPDSFLFLATQEDQRDDLIPLLSAWFAIAIKALMGMGENYDRRLFFFNDELASMGEIAGLYKLLREGRKYGACAILATQNPAQIDSIYGRIIAEDLLSNLRTKLVFAVEEAKIAKRLSELFGEKEVLEAQEGLSYGAHQMRDGVSQSMITRKIPAIAPTEIQRLGDNECFLKLCGGEAIEKLKLKYVVAKNVAKDFEAKPGILDIKKKEKEEAKETKPTKGEVEKPPCAQES